MRIYALCKLPWLRVPTAHLQEMLVGRARPALPLMDMVEQITPAAPRHPREVQAHANAGMDPSLSMATASFMGRHARLEALALLVELTQPVATAKTMRYRRRLRKALLRPHLAKSQGPCR
ncbi:hypothetical protein ABBQ38_000390 [Trebouxia sp. C0009 RCD-2024]